MLQSTVNPLTPAVAIWVQLWSIQCQTGLSRSFVIFDIRALWRSWLSVRVSGCQKLQMTGLTRSGTGCSIAVPIWQQWQKRERVNLPLNPLTIRSCSVLPNDFPWTVTRHKTQTKIRWRQLTVTLEFLMASASSKASSGDLGLTVSGLGLEIDRVYTGLFLTYLALVTVCDVTGWGSGGDRRLSPPPTMTVPQCRSNFWRREVVYIAPFSIIINVYATKNLTPRQHGRCMHEWYTSLHIWFIHFWPTSYYCRH